MLIGCLIGLSGCGESQPPQEIQSSFHDTAACDTQLKDIVSGAFNLREIPLNALTFNFEVLEGQQEIISINANKNEVSDAMSIGRLKVLKDQGQILNSTFGDGVRIEVDLAKHPDFIKNCF